MNTISKLTAVALLVGLAGSAVAAPIRVLIVDGFSNHDWKLTTALIRGIIEPTGQFTVDVSTAPPSKTSSGWDTWRPQFKNYDVVIQNCNDIKGGPAWPREVQVAFENFVTNGGGVYVWHSANNAFANWPAYNEMIGLGWRKKDFGWAISVDEHGQLVRIPPGEGRDTSHGSRLDTVVKRIGEHPIHAGLPREWKTPDIEVYFYARGPAKNLEVLSYGFDPRTQMNWPLEWTVRYGAGRIYTSTFGHVWAGDTQPERMRCAGVQTMVVRALQWLAGREVTWPVPADFPTASTVSVRGEIPLPPAAAAPFTNELGIGLCTADPVAAKAAGFDFAEVRIREFTKLTDVEFENVARRFRTNGLPTPAGYWFFPADKKVVGPTVRTNDLMEYVQTAFARCERLGVKYVIWGSGDSRRVPDGFSREAAFEQLVELARLIAPEAQRHGITVVVEPLRGAESNLINTLAEGLKWVQAVNHPNFQLQVDIYHLTEQGEDPAIIRQAGAHLRFVHVSNPRGRVFPLRAEEFDYQPFFDALHDIGYRGPISVEASSTRPVEEGPAAVKFIRAAYAGETRPAAKSKDQ